MEKEVLDTSILVRYWRYCRGRARGEITTVVVRAWARELIQRQRTDAIVTPVYLEMVAGTTNRQELRLTQAFLEEFRCIDGGRIPQQDWTEAVRLAQRVRRDGSPRQLGDCLIQAISKRLRHQVATHDARFPR